MIRCEPNVLNAVSLDVGCARGSLETVLSAVRRRIAHTLPEPLRCALSSARRLAQEKIRDGEAMASLLKKHLS